MSINISLTHHLPEAYYTGKARVSFTVCLAREEKILTEGSIPELFRRILYREAAAAQCEVVIYLFMPDHCHMILQGKNQYAHTVRALGRFLRHTDFWFQEHRPGVQWEDDFFDHVLVADRDAINKVRYVLESPVGYGLVKDWKEYPYKGSTVYNLEEWKSPIPPEP